MQWIVIWYTDNQLQSQYRAFGPFETSEEAERFVSAHDDQYYPRRAMYQVIALFDPKYVRDL